jgi:hypothetical protein
MPSAAQLERAEEFLGAQTNDANISGRTFFSRNTRIHDLLSAILGAHIFSFISSPFAGRYKIVNQLASATGVRYFFLVALLIRSLLTRHPILYIALSFYSRS